MDLEKYIKVGTGKSFGNVQNSSPLIIIYLLSLNNIIYYFI